MYGTDGRPTLLLEGAGRRIETVYDDPGSSDRWWKTGTQWLLRLISMPVNQPLSRIFVGILAIALQLTISNVAADAVIRSRAMFADTIAEYYVEDDHIRLELEIGVDDVGSFRNLIPDALYQRLGYGDSPLEERLKLFITEDMPIATSDKLLVGKVVDVSPGTRPFRDDVTGEPLPTPEDEAVVVIRATIIYQFEGRPEALTFVAPRSTGVANIGFVTYHKGVAVNDYRYLTSGLTLNLDWSDTWYSSFSSRAMRRQYFASMAGFIYIEPYEVRKEIIVRPADMQRYVDLGLDGTDVIPADRHAEIKQKIVEYLADHFPVTIDGVPVQGTVDRVNFLERTLRASVVVDNQDLDLLPATMGIIYVFPTDGLPHEVEMTWDLFSEKTQVVPGAAVDQAGALPVFLEPDFNVLRWENFLQFPELPTLKAIEKPPSVLHQLANMGRWPMTILSVLLIVLLVRSLIIRNGSALRLSLAFLPIAGLTIIFLVQPRNVDLDDEQLQLLVGDLLHNVYRAFDYRGEAVIYDVLEKSVSGDLLTDIYLETQKGLELANQGGARVKVKTTDVHGAELLERDGNRLDISSSWTVAGSVGHWGHVHQRTNAYSANLEISEIDGAWKLTRLEILDEQRL